MSRNRLSATCRQSPGRRNPRLCSSVTLVRLLSAVLLAIPSASNAQVMSAEIWEGEWQKEIDNEDSNAPLYGRAIADDDSGFDVMTLYGQLKPPSGSPNIDAGGDSGFMHAEVVLAGTVNVWSMESGSHKSDAQMWYGPNFHGCAESWLGLRQALFWASRTGSCGAPGLSHYQNQCPDGYCGKSGCALSAAPYRVCASIKVTTFFTYCLGPGCGGSSAPGECLVW